MNTLTKSIVLCLSFLGLILSAHAIVQDSGIVNLVTVPQTVLVGSNFTITNHLSQIGIDYNSFQSLPDSGFENGTFTPDWNGGNWTGNTVALSFSNRLSTSAACPTSKHCANSQAQKVSSGNNNYKVFWPNTLFSYKDLIRFDVNAGNNATGTTITISSYSHGKPVFGQICSRPTNCFPQIGEEFSINVGENTSHQDLNFTVNKKWDANTYVQFRGEPSNGAFNQFGEAFFDNFERAAAYNTIAYPTDADCNAFFGSAELIDMPYNSSTGKYGTNFTAPLLGGEYSYGVTCKRENFTSYTEGIITIVPVIDLNQSIVRDPGLINVITEPNQPLEPNILLNQTFTISNKPQLIDINWTDYVLVENGTLESGQFMDFNGGRYQAGGSTLNLTPDSRLINSSSCIGNYCVEGKNTTGGTFTVRWLVWPLTLFSHKDKARFDVPYVENTSAGQTGVNITVGASGAPVFGGNCQASFNNCFPDSSTQFTQNNLQEGNQYRDFNFTIEKPTWDSNAYLYFYAVGAAGTPQYQGKAYFDNIEKAIAYNTTSFPTNVDCNASFNGSAFTPMPYNSSTGNYETNFGTPILVGDYNYAISCRHGNFTDYDEGKITVGPITELCVPIIQNGSPGEKIDVVFVGSGFPDLNTFSSVIPDFIDYNGTGYGLMSLEPFNDDNNKTMFNFWKVNSLQTMNSLAITFNTGLIGYNNCPFADQLVLLSVEPRFGSFVPVSGYPQAYVFIGKEYLQNCYLASGTCTHPWPLDTPNILNPFTFLNCQGLGFSGCNLYGASKELVVRTFVHEFGHSFGGLFDEYERDGNSLIDTNSGLLQDLILPGLPNCDNSTCNKWITSIPGSSCELSCSYDNWYRAYPNTIMKDQYELPYVDYKGVNERQLNKQMEKFSGSVGGQSSYSYIVDLNNTNGNISLSNIKLVLAESPNNIGFNADYRLKLVDDSNQLLHDQNFNFPLTVEHLLPTNAWDINGVQFPVGEPYETFSSTIGTVVLPYSNLTKFLQLFDANGTMVLSKDISAIQPISYTIGYGGNRLSEIDLNLDFSLLGQPTGKLTGEDFNIIIGAISSIGN